jgi:PhzF family phenazine biosynthesis protein
LFAGYHRFDLSNIHLNMASYPFRIVNVFAESPLGGNPLCVFEKADGLDDVTMQALALQFNLSETTFVFPSDRATAKVRIFTTGYEMRFAGHPTLGTAHVLRQLNGGLDHVTLELKAGLVPVQAQGDVWTLTAPSDGPPKVKPLGMALADAADLVGLAPADLLSEPQWLDTGTDQLLFPLKTIDAVRRASPNAARIAAWPLSSLDRKTAYVFAFDQQQPSRIVCRYFFTKDGGGVAEDPGTGSACANLGGWIINQNRPRPASFQLEQGDAVKRACRLMLSIGADDAIKVGGRVIELGRGNITL